MVNALKDSFNYTPPKQKMVAFFRAVSSGDTAAIEKFLDEYPAALDAGIAAHEYRDITALIYGAATKGRTDTAKLLLERGATVDAKDNAGHTALLWAARCGYTDLVKFLQGKGAAIDAKDNAGRTGLMWAAERRDKDMVALLLDSGANINERDNFGDTALTYAAEGQDEDIVALLREKGTPETPANRTALSLMVDAVKRGYPATIAKLLDEHGAAIINNRDIHGWTPLSWAARMGQKDTVQLFLDRGADINMIDGYCMTALIQAAAYKHKDIVELLLKNGASTKGKDNAEGMTALMWAAQGEDGSRDIVKLLLEGGAATGEKDNEGRTVMTVAKNHDHPEIVELLENWIEERKQHLFAERKRRTEERRAKWLRDTDFSSGLKKPIPARRPFNFSPRKV